MKLFCYVFNSLLIIYTICFISCQAKLLSFKYEPKKTESLDICTGSKYQYLTKN